MIPEATTSIAEDAFEDFLVSSLQVAPGNPVYHSDGNCLIVTAEKRMMINGRSCTIPADGSVTTIGGECFYLYKEKSDIKNLERSLLLFPGETGEAYLEALETTNGNSR